MTISPLIPSTYIDPPPLPHPPPQQAATHDHHLICRCVATISTDHTEAISSLVLSSEHLFSASFSDEISVWEQPDLESCTQFHAGSGSAKALLIYGDRIIGAHQDNKIRIWQHNQHHHEAPSAPSYKPIATLPSKKDCFLKSFSQKNYVQVRRHHKKLWIEHADAISVLAVMKSRGILYSGSWDKTVKVWRLADFKCVESIRAHDDAVNTLAVSEDGGCLYTGSADGKVKVWRKELGAKKHSLLAIMEGGHEKGASVNALAMVESSVELLFSGGSDGAMAVWGRRKGEQHISLLLQKISGCHRLPILCLQPTNQASGFVLLSGSADKCVRIWRIRSGKDGRDDDGEGYLSCVGVLEGHRGAVKAIAIAAVDEPPIIVGRGGFLVYTGSSDKSIKAWWLSGISQDGANSKTLPRHHTST